MTNAFPDLFEAMKTVSLPSNLNDTQWQQIHDDVLHQNNPYRDVIIKEMEQILEGIFDFESPVEEIKVGFDTRMVSPIPSTNNIPKPITDFTAPTRKPPASVIPKCNG